MKVRLRYDGLKQSEFFRTLLKMYVEKDPLMLDIVEKIKEEQKIMGKNKLKNNKKDYQRSDQLLSDLGIDKTDKESMFDLIEQTGENYE